MTALAELPITDLPQRTNSNVLRNILEKNYFYIVSVVLMILGVRLLMHAATTPGEIFEKVFHSLLILQGYEGLLIATSLLIVWRLKRLDDALTLFLIQLLLLFDPTFFSDNFATMARTDNPPMSASIVNIASLVLVPVKLYVLQYFLKFRLSDRLMWGIVLAAGYVYALEFSLGVREDHRSESYVYYALSWVPFALALLLPAISSAAKISGENNWSTGAQQSRLRLMAVIIPFAAVIIHFVQSSWSQDIPFYSVYASSLLLAVGVLIVSNLSVKKRLAGLLAVDAICVMALVCSFPEFNIKSSNLSVAFYGESLKLFQGIVPLVLAGAGACVLYLMLAIRLRWYAPLARIAVLGAMGLISYLTMSGVVASASGYMVDKLAILAAWGWNNAPILGGALWLLLSISTWAIGGRALVCILAFATVFWVFSVPPGSIATWSAEVFQCLLLTLAGLIHFYSSDPQTRGVRLFLAFLAASVGMINWFSNSGTFEFAFLILEGIGLLVVGVAVKEHGYTITGGISLAVVALRGGWQWFSEISPAALALTLALAIFGAGVAVTFFREKLLERLEPDPAPLGPPETDELNGEINAKGK